MVALAAVPFYGVRPFAAAFYLALIFLDLPLWLVSPLYVAAEVVGGGADIFAFFSAAVVCAVVIGFRLIYVKTKKKHKWLFGIAAPLLSAGQAAFMTFTAHTWLQVLLYAALAAGFSLASMHAAKPVVKEKLRYKMLETETVCLCIIAAAASAGLSALSPFGFPLSALIAAYCIFIAAKISGAGKACLAALILGAGSAVYSYDIAPIAAFAFIAVLASAFASAPKIILPLAGLCGYVIFRFFFFTDIAGAVLWICAVAAAGLAYFLTPASVLAKIKNYLFTDAAPAASRYMVHLNRAETASRLSGAANVFRSMAESLEYKESDLPDYTGSLKNRCCAMCENHPRCAGAGFDAALDELTQHALKKGRPSIGDIPQYLSDRCINLARLVASGAAIGEAHQKLLRQNESDLSARSLVTAQMRGMTEVLDDLAGFTARPAAAQQEREKVLVEELNYGGVAAAQSLISDSDVSIVVRSETFDRKTIEKSVSRVLRRRYGVTSLDDTVLAGFCAVGLKSRPPFDAVFGLAAAPKKAGDVSGDAHSFIKIGNTRFMMAICDGMGSGSAAGKLSATALGLVENYYRAGFSGEFVLRSVNRFLARTGGESFSALDICVVNLETLSADIIKLGSPATYVKRKDTVQRFDGAGVPIGVLDAVQPSVETVTLEAGDILVLSSDGVADSFEGDKLTAAVNNARTTNPQTLSEAILEHALFNCGGTLKDDATVLTARIIAV